jgi:hypothetical protein
MPKREAPFNDNGFHEEAGRRKEVGPNCTLSLASGDDVAVSNVSFSEEASTSEVQYTDSFAQSIAVTGVTYSGSFEIPGNANAERDTAWTSGGGDQPTLPEHLDQITITDGEDTSYTFKNVLLSSHSKDIPSDDRTTQSFDFMAEALTVN